MGSRAHIVSRMILEDIAGCPLRRSTIVLAFLGVALLTVWLMSSHGFPRFSGDTWSVLSYGGGITLRAWEPAGRPRFPVERGWLPFSLFWGIPDGNRTYAWVFYASLAYYVLLLPVVIPLALRAAAVVRRWLTWQPGTCRGCGYDLRASPSRCPECGLEVSSLGRA